MTRPSKYPVISIVTPVYNRAAFIEQTIQSVLNQAYPNLEYVVIDGGSTDGTVEIIERYAEHLTYWTSEPDGGMYEALQKGFWQTSGDIMGWLNSDDRYFDWSLQVVGQLFRRFQQVEWLTTNKIHYMNRNGLPLTVQDVPGYSRAGYYRGEHLPLPGRVFGLPHIMQESTFWRRSLWEKSGATMDVSLQYAGDAELWLRFFRHSILYDVSLPLAQFRIHRDQLSGRSAQGLLSEVEQLIQRYDVQPHTALGGWLRGMARQYTPKRLRFLAARVGYLHRSYNLRYSLSRADWEIRTNYY